MFQDIKMDMFMKKKPKINVIDLIKQREIQATVARGLSHKLKVTSNFVERLGLEKELNGHEGCVNCLDWNEKGTILASASDDLHVILWDPFRYKQKLKMQTNHRGNIFTVKIMPKSDDSIIVTGAGDMQIFVTDINDAKELLACRCHIGRIKRIATAPSIPFLFWSAAEDGVILQYDLREPHSCKPDNQTVLVNLQNHMGNSVEAKCININPRRPELIAIGANDSYVRMYDRRMIKLAKQPSLFANPSVIFPKGDLDNNVPLNCVQYFVAGHLTHRDHCKKCFTTYLTFSDDGNELLVNMGIEQIYLFDINNHSDSRNFIIPAETNGYNRSQDCNESHSKFKSSSTIVQDLSAINVTELSPEVENLKQQANEAYNKEQYSIAISLYNKALSICPCSAILHGNRAGTYMKRAWNGDSYAALRDCRITLALDPTHVKAHFRLARCLFDLHRVHEAHIVMKNFYKRFPEFTNNSACKVLRKDIKEALRSGEYATTSSERDEMKISDYEKEWRKKAIDFKMRLCGHCNKITDIKEVNFFGDEGQYIIAGSDDGYFFFWDRYTTNITRVLRGDQRIVNCIQPHPSTCFLATTGIDPVVRLWSPMPEDGSVNTWEINDLNKAAAANFVRMNTDYFDLMLQNMGYRLHGSETPNDEEDNENQEQDPLNIHPLYCRPS